MFILLEGVVMVWSVVNGDSDHFGMVMIMFHNTGDYQWDGNDNVLQHRW